MQAYGGNLLSNTLRIARAVVTNQIARFTPRFYLKLTGQTGRGSEEETAAQIAGYFKKCFDDYFAALAVSPKDIGDYLKGKCVLEYGPGDIPGVALLMIAHGAKRVYCVDRFPMVSWSKKNIHVLQCLLEGLEGDVRARAEQCFLQNDPRSGFNPHSIDYLVRPSGLSGLVNEADLVISRAVLEHVDDLSATFSDMHQALRAQGIGVHLVDLKSHGLHRTNPLDFLAWPQYLWTLMYSQKGVPNRWRIDRYRQALAHSGLETLRMEPTVRAEQKDIDSIRPFLAKPFQALSDEELSWLGFWLVCVKRS